MNECPVCRSPLFGRPDQCDECGSPLSRSIYSSSFLARLMTLFFPGVGHLWLGRLITGVIVSFFSALSVIVLFQMMADEFQFLRRVAFWVLFWIPWVAGWYWQVKDLRRRFVEAEQVVTTLTILLILSNFTVLITTVLLISGWNYG